MALLLHYIYYGEVHVPRHQVQDFLKTAKQLQIRGLKEQDNLESEGVQADSPGCKTETNGKVDSPSDKIKLECKEAENSANNTSVSSTHSPGVQSPSIEASTSVPSSSASDKTFERTDTVSIIPKNSTPKSTTTVDNHSAPSSPALKKAKLVLNHSVYDSPSSPATRITPPSLLNHPLASALKPTLPTSGIPGLPGVPMPPMPIPATSFPHHALPPASAAQVFNQHMSQQMSHHFSQQMSHQMNHPLSHHMSQQMSHQFSQQMNQQLTQQMNQQLSQQMSHPTSDDASDTCASDKSEDRSNARNDQDGDEEMDSNSLEKMSGLANMAALKGE